MHQKLIASGLFAVALGLFAIAWCVHDQTQRHGRYALGEGLVRLDTLTGAIDICRAIGRGIGECQPFVERVSPFE